MLLPSALACDVVQTSRTPTRALLSSPLPPSSPAFTNIYNACRALQLILTPPTSLQGSVASSPPSRKKFPALRLRSQTPTFKVRERKHPSFVPEHRVTKRTVPVALSFRNQKKHEYNLSPKANKSASLLTDDLGTPFEQRCVPTTPQRVCFEPQLTSFGLGRVDFHELEGQENRLNKNIKISSPHMDEAGQWSIEEDRLLIQLVLEKLRLSKDDWDYCACSLGRNSESVDQRWKSLILQGMIGLKQNSRSHNYSTWE